MPFDSPLSIHLFPYSSDGNRGAHRMGDSFIPDIRSVFVADAEVENNSSSLSYFIFDELLEFGRNVEREGPLHFFAKRKHLSAECL